MSMRNTLVEYIVAKIQAMDDSTYTQSYRIVTRDPISQEHLTKLQAGEAVVGVYEGDEDKEYLFSHTNVKLEIIIEFYYKPKLSEVKATELNRILADLIKVMRVDYSQGGNAVRTDEISNNIDIDGIYDKIVNGSIKFEVLYRHGVYDPLKSNC